MHINQTDGIALVRKSLTFNSRFDVTTGCLIMLIGSWETPQNPSSEVGTIKIYTYVIPL